MHNMIAHTQTSKNKQVQCYVRCSAGEQSLDTASSHYNQKQVHNINSRMKPAACFCFSITTDSAPHWGLSSCQTASWKKAFHVARCVVSTTACGVHVAVSFNLIIT